MNLFMVTGLHYFEELFMRHVVLCRMKSDSPFTVTQQRGNGEAFFKIVPPCGTYASHLKHGLNSLPGVWGNFEPPSANLFSHSFHLRHDTAVDTVDHM